MLKVHGKHFVVEFRGRELADLVVEFVGAVLVVEETVRDGCRGRQLVGVGFD